MFSFQDKLCVRHVVRNLRLWSAFAAVFLCCAGCGTTKNTTATDQLLMSDAVDGAIARIDFTPLENQKVYFDTKFIKDYKGVGFVNSDYVISSTRQQMIAAGVLLQEKEDTADFIVEGRIGALGTDSNEVIYGIPSTSVLNEAADAVAALSQAPAVPGIPELAVAKRSNQISAAKIAVFAYEKESRERVWQSGMLTGKSTSRDLWVMGAGPFQKGSIHDEGVKFAGSTLDVPLMEHERDGLRGPIAAYRDSMVFNLPGTKADPALAEQEGEDGIQQVSGEKKDESAKAAK
ncbi:DUF6655 family protein [Thalassoglobus polymorphus]|uniref:Uncharacterized protein n=1 Tax=Thalassoglobus polymorphus TaxID=2527994 RepID=A0A517QHZ5_9PLAN|nr:DUF6655 family protein [Thalassoglobus polymorphus]QDT31260.1 hypothetical protein Mal48_04930 [Thalassoglobus polymorphus]